MTTTRELVAWSHQKKCEKAVQSPGKNGFAAVYCPSREEAVAYIVGEAADAASVGFGNSLSLADLEVADRGSDYAAFPSLVASGTSCSLPVFTS